MELILLVALLTLVGCSKVAATCIYEPGTIIPMGTRCTVPFGFFQFQNDGNVVIYDGNSKPLWNTQTAGIGHTLAFQTDGNLVVYTRDWRAVWNSQTASKGGELLAFQDDRNLVIYNKSNKPIWYTSTSYH